MQEENKFEDLVLDNLNKKNKQKQLIFKGIIAMIVILVILIAFKIISNVGDKTPPLPPIDSNPNFEQKDQNSEVFENIKVNQEEFSDDFTPLTERLKRENNIVEAEPKKSQEVQNVVKELAKVEPKKEVVQEVQPKVEKVEPKKELPKKVETTVKKQNSESSVFDTLNVSKPASLPTHEIKAPNTSNQGSFIQVYAGKNIDLKSHEIKKLDSLGLKYKVVTDNKGMSRVIVGPYSSSDKANALKYIRDNVKKDAFYYHAK